MALLQDFHHSPAVLDYQPNYIAIACINLTLQIYGVVVPLMDECDQIPWFTVSIYILLLLSVLLKTKLFLFDKSL